MCTKRDFDYITNKVVECYRKEFGEKIIKILLFGSYARGEQNEDSDIDYVAIVDGDRLDLQNRVKNVWDAMFDISLEKDVVVSPTIVPYDEFEKYKGVSGYYKNIESEGIRVG